ncbi:uncharacterized protein [Palaemon carinicauda]|uniref:uncharacterized protein n=1 Tax=Palaemon carinicauda TaxID=392227 RepID=UPI0035B63609
MLSRIPLKGVLKSAEICLVAANSPAIPTHGHETFTLLFGSGKYIWKFLLADVILPIFHANFLSHFHLLVDVAHRQLIYVDSSFSTCLQLGPSDFALHISAPMNSYAHFLISYPEVFCPGIFQMSTVPAKHNIFHHMKTRVFPVFARFKRLESDCLAAAKKTLAEMEEMGLCQKASSPYSSPLPIVLERDASLCPCGD